MADSAGKGILIVAVCHGLAQLEARWDSAGARAIWDTAGIKVILGGVADADTLDQLFRLCGEVALRTRSHTREGKRVRTVTYGQVRVLPPELLRTLPEWRALVVRTNLSPVVVRLRMAWRRHDYRHARRHGAVPYQAMAIAAADSTTPVQPGPATGTDLIPFISDEEPWHSLEAEHPATPSDGELTAGPMARQPGAVPDWVTRQDDAALWTTLRNDRPSHPRRPWEPPVPGERS
jgi:hypothetical protein